MSMNTSIAYLDCEVLHKNHNRAGKNYWGTYWQEIFGQLGYTATRYDSTNDLCKNLSNCRVVFLDEIEINTKQKDQICSWVEKGGILVGSLTAGLDDLFGIMSYDMRYESDDIFSIQAYVAMKEDAYPYLPDAAKKFFTLPVISKFRLCCTVQDANSMAYILEPSSFIVSGKGVKDTGIPAFWKRNICKGQVFYFPFSIPQTMCILHQGRPVDRDWDGDGYYRTGDSIVLTQCHDLTHAYADSYLHILQAILDKAEIPSIFQLPPKGGKLVDMVLHYGGDDECDYSGVQLKAASKMQELGLPYHINIQPNSDKSGFAVTPEDYESLQNLSCERSIHFDFFKTRTVFTEEDVYEQLDLYVRTFGETPVCSVNHVLMWNGWVDFPRWCWQKGMKGDASRAHKFLVPEANPVNSFGLGFGTAFPHFVMDDWRYNNRFMDYVYMPIMLYEPRITKDNESEDLDQLYGVIDIAKEEAWLLSVFYHPVYIVNEPACLKAIMHTLDYIKEKNYRVLHMGTDMACLWWHSRNNSSVTLHDNYYLVHAAHEDGVVVRFPERGETFCMLDGKRVEMERRQVSGRSCLLIVVPFGKHRLSIK